MSTCRSRKEVGWGHPNVNRDLKSAVREYGRRSPHYGMFLSAILLLTLVHAFFGQHAALRVLFDIGFFVLMLPAIRLIMAHRRLRWVGIALGAAAALGNVVFLLNTSASTSIARDVLAGTLLVTTTVVVFVDVLRPGAISWNKIMGAISVYLLIGFCFALIYAVLNGIDDGAFAGSVRVLTGGALSPAAPFLYYSFVTLTTLGFGDVLPASPAARTLTWIEAVLGQLYLTVLVARLVGLHIVQSQGRPDDVPRS